MPLYAPKRSNEHPSKISLKTIEKTIKPLPSDLLNNSWLEETYWALWHPGRFGGVDHGPITGPVEGWSEGWVSVGTGHARRLAAE